MPAGSIVVDLLLRSGSFETDTKRAEQRLSKLEAGFGQLATAATVGAAGFLAFAAAAVKSNAQAIDAFNDLKDATGASIETISALDRVARETGGNFDTVSTSLLKFNQVLGGTDEESKTAAAVLDSIGLSAKALKQIDPAEALRQTAAALSKFADDGDKARAIQLLFGKATKEIAPFLKDLGEQTKLTATTTTSAAEEAERFGKALSKLQADSTDFARSLTSDLIPALSSVLENYRALKQLGGFDLVLKDATKGFFGFQSDIVGDVGKNIERLRVEREKLQEATAPDPDFAEAFASQTKDRIAEIDRLLAVLAERQARAQNALNTSTPNRPSVKVPSIGKSGPKGKDPDADFRAYLNNLELQIQRTQDLTAVEKLLDDIRRGSLTVTPAQQSQLEGLAQIIDKEKELTEQIKIRRDVTTAAGDAVIKANEEYQSLLQRLLSATPTAQLEESRRDIQVLTDEFQRFIDTAGQSGISESLYLEAVSERLNLTGKGLEKNKGLAEELGLTFESAAENAIVDFKSLRDVLSGLEKDIIRIITRRFVTNPLADYIGEALKPLEKAGASGLGGLLGKIFGSASSSSTAGLGLESIFGGQYANGGIPPIGKVSVVGERGPELFVPNTAGRIIPNEMMSLTKPNVTKSAQFYTTINVPPNTSRESSTQMAAEFLRKVNVGYRNL